MSELPRNCIERLRQMDSLICHEVADWLSEGVVISMEREAAETVAHVLGGSAAGGVDHGMAAYNAGTDAIQAALATTQKEEL